MKHKDLQDQAFFQSIFLPRCDFLGTVSFRAQLLHHFTHFMSPVITFQLHEGGLGEKGGWKTAQCPCHTHTNLYAVPTASVFGHFFPPNCCSHRSTVWTDASELMGVVALMHLLDCCSGRRPMCTVQSEALWGAQQMKRPWIRRRESCWGAQGLQLSLAEEDSSPSTASPPPSPSKEESSLSSWECSDPPAAKPSDSGFALICFVMLTL